MAGMTFTLRSPTPERLDLSRLNAPALAGRSLPEILRIVVGTTKLKLTVGDLFRVSGDDVTDISLEAASERLDFIGHGLARGAKMTVFGDVGAYAGRGMTGGDLVISGSAGPCLGAGMTGGRISVSGDTGDLTGGAVAGEMAGMSGGIITVSGVTGERTGDRMKRGLIVALGGTGEAPGSRMMGGTILTERLGARAGYLMRRGTLIGNSAESLLPTFLESGHYQGTFMGLFQRWISEEVPEAEDLLFGRARRLRGDMATIGKGELLLPV